MGRRQKKAQLRTCRIPFRKTMKQTLFKLKMKVLKYRWQREEEEDDIKIHLGRKLRTYNSKYRKEYPINYNISRFLRQHKFSRNQIANIDQFIQLLDAKVYVDTSDTSYSHIYKGIDIIVKRLFADLTKLDPFFAYVKLRQTGSSMSGVKVGLPHEADYVLELPRDKQLSWEETFNELTLIRIVHKIVAHRGIVLTEGLKHWVIHGVKFHLKTGGVCLVMQCCAKADDSLSGKVGVTVDLVPVYVEYTTDEILNKKAATFLPQSLEEYAKTGELYRLINKKECDTGFIDNNIIKQLPEDIKSAYRVAKFLISNLFVSNTIPFDRIAILDKETRLSLYGREPWISSYLLRVILFRLLLHVQGTKAEQRLKGGLLVLCILDVLIQFMEKDDVTFGVTFWSLDHPLITDTECFCLFPFPIKLMLDIKRLLVSENPAKMVEGFSLINSKTPV